MRGIAASGSPFSTTSPVGSSVAGSMVSRQTPSNGTRATRMRVGAVREVAHVGAAVQQTDEVPAHSFG